MTLIAGVSRRVRRRVNQKGHRETRLEDLCRTLRELDGFGDGVTPCKLDDPVNEASRIFLADEIRKFGSLPSELRSMSDGADAANSVVSELLGCHGYDGEALKVVPLDIGRLDLPLGDTPLVSPCSGRRSQDGISKALYIVFCPKR